MLVPEVSPCGLGKKVLKGFFFYILDCRLLFETYLLAIFFTVNSAVAVELAF